MTVKLATKKSTIEKAPSFILIKKRESILLKEIILLEKNMTNYMAERKVSLKSFKSK